MILFAFVSFCIAIDRAGEDPGPVSSLTPEKWLRWLQVLSERTSKVHPEWVQLVVDSPIADFTTSQCLGAIINVFSCTWHHLVSYMLRANVPIWLYWGILPGFSLHPNHGALHFAPCSHPKSKASPALPPSQALPLSQSISFPVCSGHRGPDQLPGEAWKDFMERQNMQRRAKLSRESSVERQS